MEREAAIGDGIIILLNRVIIRKPEHATGSEHRHEHNLSYKYDFVKT